MGGWVVVFLSGHASCVRVFSTSMHDDGRFGGWCVSLLSVCVVPLSPTLLNAPYLPPSPTHHTNSGYEPVAEPHDTEEGHHIEDDAAISPHDTEATDLSSSQQCWLLWYVLMTFSA